MKGRKKEGKKEGGTDGGREEGRKRQAEGMLYGNGTKDMGQLNTVHGTCLDSGLEKRKRSYKGHNWEPLNMEWILDNIL